MSPEYIQPIENSIFASSVGNWQGPCEWVKPGITGFLLVPFHFDPGTKIISLSYPYVSTGPDVDNWITFQCDFSPVDANRYLEWTLTDGVYTFSWNHTFDITHTGYTADEHFTPNKKWNKNQTVLSLSLQTDYTGEAAFYLWNIFLDSETIPKHHIDWLPIMGVG